MNDLQIFDTAFQKITKVSLQIKGIPDIQYDRLLRGLHSSSLSCLMTVHIGKTVEVFISTFGRSFSKEKAVQIVKSRQKVIESLLAGCVYEIAKPAEIVPKIHSNSVLIDVLGVPPQTAERQFSEFVNKLHDVGIPTTVLIGIAPTKVAYDAQKDRYLSTPVKRSIISNYFLKQDAQRALQKISDASFLVKFGIFLARDNLDQLRHDTEAVNALLGSIYNSPSSKIRISIAQGKRAINTCKQLLMGILLNPVWLSTAELSTIFQIPQAYGIPGIAELRFTPPIYDTDGVEIGTILGSRNEELGSARFDDKSVFEHVAVWGASGTGKTTLLKHLAIKLHNEKDLKLAIFDFHNEYRALCGELKGKLGKDILVINPLITSFSVNPLELFHTNQTEKDIALTERIENFISLLKQMFILGEIQESRVRKALYRTYCRGTPKISDLVDELSAEKEDNLTTKLGKFTHGFYGEIFNRKQSSLPFENIERSTTIFELGQLPQELRAFFVSVFLILWWDWRRANKTNCLPHILILDEFHHYSGVRVVQKMLSEARKYKEGLICSHQGPNQLEDKSILEDLVRNTATKIIFRQEQLTDKRIIASALGGLEKDQIDYLSSLKIGEAVVKLKNIGHPFRIRTFPPIKLKEIADEEIKSAFLSEAREKTPEESLHLEDLERRFLGIIVERGSIPTTEIAKHLRIKTSRAYDIERKLKAQGLLIEEKIRIGTGRPKKVLKLSDKALRTLDVKQEKPPAHYGKEEHREIIQRVAKILRNNEWNVKMEQECDTMAEKSGQKIAIEVETGKTKDQNQVIYNIKRDLNWADKIIVICPNKQIKQGISQLIGGQKIEKAAVITYDEIKMLDAFLPKN